MIQRLRIRQQLLSIIALLIIILGIAIRLKVYMQNRSLIIDEANLARNIVEKDYGGYFKSLDYEQYAPPLYSVLTKVLTKIIGVNEFAFRLPSLVAGIMSLLLILWIGKTVIKKRVGIWYTLMLFACSILAIRYATEFKPYAGDAAITLGFVWWALKTKQNGIRPMTILWWTLIGIVVVWYSMPVVFTLAAAGLAIFLEAWNTHRKIIPSIILMGLAWAISFGTYYLLILHHDAHTDYLTHYHKAYFFDFLPASRAEASQSLELLISLFRSATDQTIISLAWAGSTFLTGLLLLFKKNRFAFILLGGPVLFCLIASHLQVYSLIPRLTLFIIPLIIILIGAGVSLVWEKANRIGQLVLLAVMILTIINKDGYTYLWERMELENSKSVMKYIKEHPQNDTFIFVQHDGVPAFIFYNEMYDQPWGFTHYYLAHWDDSAEQLIRQSLKNSGDDTFWIFLSHTFPQKHIDQYILMGENIGDEIDRFISTQASCYLFKRN